MAVAFDRPANKAGDVGGGYSSQLTVPEGRRIYLLCPIFHLEFIEFSPIIYTCLYLKNQLHTFNILIVF